MGAPDGMERSAMSPQPASGSAGTQCSEGEAVQPLLPEQEYAPATRKQPRDRRLAHIEPAAIGAERRHHDAACIGDEAWPADAAAARGNCRLRMMMAGNLGLRAGDRLV